MSRYGQLLYSCSVWNIMYPWASNKAPGKSRKFSKNVPSLWYKACLAWTSHRSFSNLPVNRLPLVLMAVIILSSPFFSFLVSITARLFVSNPASLRSTELGVSLNGTACDLSQEYTSSSILIVGILNFLWYCYSIFYTVQRNLSRWQPKSVPRPYWPSFIFLYRLATQTKRGQVKYYAERFHLSGKNIV